MSRCLSVLRVLGVAGVLGVLGVLGVVGVLGVPGSLGAVSRRSGFSMCFHHPGLCESYRQLQEGTVAQVAKIRAAHCHDIELSCFPDTRPS